MTFLIPVALIGWIPFSLVLFQFLPRRWAPVVAIIFAWLILPPTSIRISGLTEFGKEASYAFGAILATLVFMPDRILKFRPCYLDFFMCAFCLSPIPASLTNGLGFYDGISASIGRTTVWGLAYLVGRVHFNGERSLRDLMVGIAVGGIALIPLCLYEMRMSPVLMRKLYGIGVFGGMRYGGWRPSIFFRNGLDYGMWMSVCLFTTWWLWRSGILRQLAGWSVGRVLLPALAIVTVLSRSTGALALLVIGGTAFWTSVRFNKRLPALLLTVASLLYIGVRVPDLWDYSGLVSFLSENLDADRAQSLEYRFQNEDMLINKAVEKPLFGWGGWARSHVFDENGKDLTVTDGLWIIYLGTTGAFGLGTFLAAWLLPCCLFIWRYKPAEWRQPIAVGQAATVCIIGMYMLDCLLNAFPNSVYVVALGGLVSSLQAGRDESLADGMGAGRPRLPAGDGRFLPPPPNAAETTETRLADQYVELARRAQRSGSGEGAAPAWRHALRFLEARCAASPDDRSMARRRLDCANDLAWFLAARSNPEDGDRDEAVKLARSTTEAEPRDPAYWNTLALALYRAGDDLGAIEAAERSMELTDASTGFDFVVLALAYARLGRKDEAAAWLVAAREWRDSNQTRDKAFDELVGEAAALVG